MSGNGDRSDPDPTKHPFTPDDSAPRALPRARRAKPPPGIITAGGVDMARAHAAGIRVRETTTPDLPRDEPRVVLSVETDARKVPTSKRLLEARAAAASTDGGRAALLPVTPGEATIVAPGRGPRASQDPAPTTEARPRRRIFAHLALLLGVLSLASIGVVRRAREPTTQVRVAPRVSALLRAMPTAADSDPDRAPVEEPMETEAAPKVVDPKEAVTSTPPHLPPPRPRPNPNHPRQAPRAPSAPEHEPPFQLPGEKNHG